MIKASSRLYQQGRLLSSCLLKDINDAHNVRKQYFRNVACLYLCAFLAIACVYKNTSEDETSESCFLMTLIISLTAYLTAIISRSRQSYSDITLPNLISLSDEALSTQIHDNLEKLIPTLKFNESLLTEVRDRRHIVADIVGSVNRLGSKTVSAEISVFSFSEYGSSSENIQTILYPAVELKINISTARFQNRVDAFIQQLTFLNCPMIQRDEIILLFPYALESKTNIKAIVEKAVAALTQGTEHNVKFSDQIAVPKRTRHSL